MTCVGPRCENVNIFEVLRRVRNRRKKAAPFHAQPPPFLFQPPPSNQLKCREGD
jgi:hypothetical protein